jgi:hypothetical protein
MTPASVDLYWLPLGAGGRFVGLNGLIYEAFAARSEHRQRCALYHSALEVTVGPERHVIETAPVWNERSRQRGVVSEGAVGSRFLGRFRAFRYEVRCWHGGRIPDVADAVDSPRPLTTDPAAARLILDLVPSVPTPVWGRDELGAGDMWNSNSIVAWLLARAGLDTEDSLPPAGGRAPGRDAGLVVARRDSAARQPLAA